MSPLLVSIAIAVAFLFSPARSQWVHCGPEFGFPTLGNCQAALDVMAAVPHPETAFVVGPREVLPMPDDIFHSLFNWVRSLLFACTDYQISLCDTTTALYPQTFESSDGY